MNHTAVRHPTQNLGFVLRFPSLFDGGRGYAFPCDARGEVDIAVTEPAGAPQLPAPRPTRWDVTTAFRR